MEAWVAYCGAEAPATNAANDRALLEWKERNRWAAFLARLEQQSKFSASFAQLRTSFVDKLRQQRTSSPAEVCQYVPALMRRAEYDPSAQRGQDIQRLADRLEQQPGDKANVQAADNAPPATITTAAAPKPAAGPLTAGAVTFTPPPGWTVAESSGGTTTLEHNDERGKRSSIIVGSDPLPGPLIATLRNALTTTFRDFDLKIDRIDEAKTTHGHAAAYFDEYARHRTKRQRLRFAGVAVDLSGRMQIAWLLTPDGAASYDRKRELEEMVRSWSYVGSAKPSWDPLKPPRGSGGLSGLYWGVLLQNQLNPFGGMDLVALRKYMLLLPNGWAYSDVPPGGKVMDIDFAAELRRVPKRCGLYSVQGDQLVFDWITDFGLIQRTTLPFQRRGANNVSFNYEGASMNIVRPAPKNLRLSDEYTSTFHMSGNLGGSSNSVTSQRSIAFTPDGRYRKSGFAAFSFSNDAGTGTTSGAGYNPRAPNTGRYVIDGYTLTLTPDQGLEEVFTLVIEKFEPEVTALFIDDNAFLK